MQLAQYTKLQLQCTLQNSVKGCYSSYTKIILYSIQHSLAAIFCEKFTHICSYRVLRRYQPLCKFQNTELFLKTHTYWTCWYAKKNRKKIWRIIHLATDDLKKWVQNSFTLTGRPFYKNPYTNFRWTLFAYWKKGYLVYHYFLSWLRVTFSIFFKKWTV